MHLRIAQYADKIYFDLADPEWRAVEIDPSGWRVVHEPAGAFRRTAGMAALPVPQPGGSITQLRSFVNLSDANFVLFVAVLVDALLPGHPHPVLYLAGEEGSIKSTTAEDCPQSDRSKHNVSLRTLPRSVRDLFVDAHGAHMLRPTTICRVFTGCFRCALSDHLGQRLWDAQTLYRHGPVVDRRQSPGRPYRPGQRHHPFRSQPIVP